MDTSRSAAYRHRETTFDTTPLIGELVVTYPDGTPFEQVTFSTRTSLMFNASIRNEMFLSNGDTIDEGVWIKGATAVHDGVRTLVIRIGIDCIVKDHPSEDKGSWRPGSIVRKIDAKMPEITLGTDAEEWQTSGEIEGFLFTLKLRRVSAVDPVTTPNDMPGSRHA